jgi:hypothetical protein
VGAGREGFEIGSYELFAWVWRWTTILLISASWIAKITGMSHRHLAATVFLKAYCDSSPFKVVLTDPWIQLSTSLCRLLSKERGLNCIINSIYDSKTSKIRVKKECSFYHILSLIALSGESQSQHSAAMKRPNTHQKKQLLNPVPPA